MITSHLSPTYARQAIAFSHGDGVWLTDTHGKRYLDALAGIAVNSLGYAHPALTTAIAEQAGKLMHSSNLFRIPLQEQLADSLCAISGMDTAFFCNSGAEANELAIKLSRLYAHQREIANPGMVVFENAFHGRTMATLSATGNSKIQKGFAPLMRGFYRAPYNDLAGVAQVIENTPELVAIMLEPIQGEAGVIPATVEFLQGLRALCDKHELLLILDEVQCGMGRTGDWFAFMSSGIRPDVITLAKGLGGGFPVGAVLMSGRANDLLKAGNHGSTFGGNPMAMAAANAVIATIQKENLLENARETGKSLQKTLSDSLQHAFPLSAKQAGCKEVRGRGLMIGVVWSGSLASLPALALEEGLVINVTHDTVIRLLPPLIFQPQHIAPLVERLAVALSKIPAQG